MEELLYCKCGHPIKVLHDQGDNTCRLDGLRFIDMEKLDIGWHLFRCPTCNEPVEQNELVELGEL